MKQAHRFVIDTCVLRAASPEGPGKPGHGKCCREILNAILENPVICVFVTRSMTEEWKENCSASAKKWRRRMNARRKIKNCQGEVYEAKLRSVRDCIEREVATTEKAPLEKDAHVLAAALCGDQIILTEDRKLCQAYEKHFSEALQWWLVPKQQVSGAKDYEDFVRRLKRYPDQ